MTQKHTPTPWEKDGSSVYDKDDNRIANCSDNILIEDQNEYNAAFIVRACNSHDALVEALKETKRSIEFMPKGIGRGAMAPLYQQICAAIAKAEGK